MNTVIVLCLLSANPQAPRLPQTTLPPRVLPGGKKVKGVGSMYTLRGSRSSSPCGKSSCGCGCEDGEVCVCLSGKRAGKSCPCSYQCTCGCNEGHECVCSGERAGTGSAQSRAGQPLYLLPSVVNVPATFASAAPSYAVPPFGYGTPHPGYGYTAGYGTAPSYYSPPGNFGGGFGGFSGGACAGGG